MDRRAANTLGAGMLAILAVVFVTAVVANQALLGGLRIDLTENRLYTLSPGTRSLLGRIEEPITLYLFFSERSARDFPALRTYAQRVRELLEEMRAASGGQLRVQVLDPLPFSEAEDRATAFGLRGASIGPLGDRVYFALAGTNAVGEEAVLPFLDPAQEAFLEYEIARLVFELMDARRPVVGLISGLDIEGGFDPVSRQVASPWVVLEQARQLYDVRSLSADTAVIDAEIDILWLLHPRDLPEQTLYAIDQFVLRGGRTLAMVDPFAQMDPAEPMATMGGLEHVPASSLNRLLDAWGVRVPPDDVVLDDVSALTVSSPGQRPERHLALLGVRRDGLSTSQVTTAGLEQVNFAFPGHILAEADSPLRVEPLIQTSPQAGRIPAAEARATPDPTALRERFTPEGQPLTLAALLTGPVPSSFADGPPARPDEDSPAHTAATEHLASSRGDIHLLLVADSDVASDRMWVQVQSFFGQRLPSPFASNGDFIINALDYLGGSEELLGLRGRATFQRPFTRVEALRREADMRLSETLARLEQELAETEQRLAALQAAREDAGTLLLSPEQEAEIDRFSQQQVTLRQELREVQRDREANIEALGRRLKILNIGLVPLLLTLVAIAGLVLRRRTAV